MHNWPQMPSYLWLESILFGTVLGIAVVGFIALLTWQNYPLPKSIIRYVCLGMVAGLLISALIAEIAKSYTYSSIKNERGYTEKYEAALKDFKTTLEVTQWFPSLGALAGVGVYFVHRLR